MSQVRLLLKFKTKGVYLQDEHILEVIELNTYPEVGELLSMAGVRNWDAILILVSLFLVCFASTGPAGYG